MLEACVLQYKASLILQRNKKTCFTEKTKSLKHQFQQHKVSLKQNCLNCAMTWVDFKTQTTLDIVALHKICVQGLSSFTASLKKGLFSILANNFSLSESHLRSLLRLDKPKPSLLKNILTVLGMLDRERWNSKITTKGIKSVITQISLPQYILWEYCTFKLLRVNAFFMLYLQSVDKRENTFKGVVSNTQKTGWINITYITY